MKKKALFSVLLFLIFCAAFCICAQASPKISKRKLTIKEGNTAILSISGNSGSKVKWSVSGKKTVSFVSKTNEQAVIIAKKAGTATITAKVGKKNLNCKVNVKKNKGIPANLKMAVGTSYTFKSKKKASWSVSDPSIASIGASGKNVKMKALGAGIVTITATIGARTQSCTVTILNKDGSLPTAQTPAPTPAPTPDPTPDPAPAPTPDPIDSSDQDDQDAQLVDGYPVKEITGLYDPRPWQSSYYMYWYGEVGSSYIYVLAEGNYIEPEDGLVIGVHSNVPGLTVTGAGAISSEWLPASEASSLDWTSGYDYILEITGNETGKGTATITGTVDGQEIKCVVPIIVE